MIRFVAITLGIDRDWFNFMSNHSDDDSLYGFLIFLWLFYAKYFDQTFI